MPSVAPPHIHEADTQQFQCNSEYTSDSLAWTYFRRCVMQLDSSHVDDSCAQSAVSWQTNAVARRILATLQRNAAFDKAAQTE
jgi:hypothetical protein